MLAGSAAPRNGPARKSHSRKRLLFHSRAADVRKPPRSYRDDDHQNHKSTGSQSGQRPLRICITPPPGRDPEHNPQGLLVPRDRRPAGSPQMAALCPALVAPAAENSNRRRGLRQAGGPVTNCRRRPSAGAGPPGSRAGAVLPPRCLVPGAPRRAWNRDTRHRASNRSALRRRRWEPIRRPALSCG